jgi:hypothetical protein
VALRRLSNSSIQTNGKSSKLWDQTTFQSGMFALATVTLTSAASSISFTNIPADYTHLQIRAMGRDNRPSTWIDSIWISFNGDTNGSNYIFHQLGGNGSSSFANSAGGQTGYGGAVGLVGAANISTSFCPNIIDILEYKSSTKNKVVRSIYGFDDNSNGTIRLGSTLWLNTAPITSLTLVNDGGSVPSNALFQQYSSFALYGIKAG